MPLRHDTEQRFAPRPGGVSPLLLGFVALSVLLHGVLLLYARQPQAPLPRLGAPVLSAVLAPAPDQPVRPTQSPAAKLHPQPAPARHTPPAATAKSRPAPHPPVRVATMPPRESRGDTNQSPPPDAKGKPRVTTTRDTAPPGKEQLAATAQQQQLAQRNYLLGQVRDRVARHFVYPRRAIRRGWQGEVVVGFRINAQGLLRDVHLARSSGYALLDHSALETLSKVGRIPLSRPTDAMDLELPVIYRLVEG
jgi:protein TonB